MAQDRAIQPGTARGDDADSSSSDAADAPTRKPLDQLTILAAAVEFIDDHGRESLTMRRLGGRLGVEAMALYRYIPGREQLLDGVVEVVMNELYQNTMVGEFAGNWGEYLQKMAHGVRDLALEHPKIFPLVATRPPAAPWLRPPLRSLRWVEQFLEGLSKRGFADKASVVVYRAFSTFLLGHLLLETSTQGGDLGLDEGGDDIAFIESNDLSDYPRLTELSGELSKDGYLDEFEDALEDLINRLAYLHHE